MADAFAELNREMTQFVTRRVSHSNEAVARMTQCTSLPQMLDAEAHWLQQAFDDYSTELGKLAEANARLFGSMFGQGYAAQRAEPAKVMAAE